MAKATHDTSTPAPDVQAVLLVNYFLLSVAGVLVACIITALI